MKIFSKLFCLAGNILVKNVKKFFFIFPVLFIFELFFGYSGKMIMLKNVSIRQFLFAGTFASLYLYCFYLIFLKFRDTKLHNKTLKNRFLSLFPKVCILDTSCLLVLLSTVFFSTVIPLINGNSLSLAKNEVFSFLLMLFLFFPLSFLIKEKHINLKKKKKYIYYLVFFLSLIHIVLFVGQDINSYFIYNYFFFLNTILGKTSIFPTIMLGHAGVPRVFFTTSIFLLIGMYFSLKKLGKYKLFDHIYLAVNILAIVSTISISLWCGILIGLITYFIISFRNFKKKKKKKKLKTFFLFLAEISAFVVISNYTIFNNRVFHHFGNSFVYENNSDYSKDDEFKEKIKEKFKNNAAAYYDREGSLISNNIKIKQIQLLLRKWMKKPILGYGYGSYLENFVRSDESPFSYEMVFFSLLMKVGTLGILFWIFLIFSLIYIKYKYRKKEEYDYFCWLFLVFSFFITVQTNPLIFNSVGMAFLLFICASALKSFATARIDVLSENRKETPLIVGSCK